MHFQRFRTSRRADVANGGDFRPVKLPLSASTREAGQPWYRSGMGAQRQTEATGILSRRRPAIAADDGLYRYVPVPPVYRDAEGYPIEDGMSQNNKHFKQTTLWYHALTLRLPTATVGSDLSMPYREGDISRVLRPDGLQQTTQLFSGETRQGAESKPVARNFLCAGQIGGLVVQRGSTYGRYTDGVSFGGGQRMERPVFGISGLRVQVACFCMSALQNSDLSFGSPPLAALMECAPRHRTLSCPGLRPADRPA